MKNAGEGVHGPGHRHAVDFSGDTSRQRKPIVSISGHTGKIG
jgi:hypothetical protein